MAEAIVGIDLGTTNSVVATTDADGDPRLLYDSEGDAIQPSVVSFHPNGSVLVGKAAKKRRVIDPSNTVYSVKRIIGRPFQAREVLAAATRVSYAIKEGANEQPVISTRAGDLAAPEISAIVLDHMRAIARTSLGHDVTRAVITVPANFTDAQRIATATAGAIAGLEIPQVINEPTAAAIAYGHKRGLDEIIAVYDFGGGTFDITLLKLSGDVYEVLGTAGDSFLGGDDIDERMVDAMIDECLRAHRVDLRDDVIAMQRLRTVAEQVKIELSRKSRALIRVDEVAYGPGGIGIDLAMQLTREELVSRSWDIVERTFPICDEVLALSGLLRSRITDVVLVGGSTKMPYVRDRVAHYFQRAPRVDVNPDESIALGAALQATAIARATGAGRPAMARTFLASSPPPPTARAGTDDEGRDTAVWDAEHGDEATTRDDLFGERTLREPQAPPDPEDSPTLPGSARATSRQSAPPPPGPPPVTHPGSMRSTLPGMSPGGASPPDAPTFVAGLAGQPATFSLPVIHDVTSHSLGVGTVKGFCDFLIERNARIPSEHRRVFSTSRDRQELVRIRVCEGESRRIAENLQLGNLVLEGLPARPRGETKIEVTFQIDASGILHVTALDQLTGVAQRASIQLRGVQSAAEVAEARERFGRLTSGGFAVPPAPR